MKLLYALKNNFSADLRSLALTRIVFSILLLTDLAMRSRYIAEFFTDSGIMPLKALRMHYPFQYNNSLHALSGEYYFELILFLAAVFFAFLLLIGLFTRIATILSWALLVSLNFRNPLILQGGDTLFKCLMFWAIFMPWGERFSVDSYIAKKDRIKEFVFSPGIMAFILQIMFMYFFSATLKQGRYWTEEYTAIYYALSISHFSYLLGPYLYDFPFIMKILTFTVYWVEFLVPLLLLIPYKNNFFRTLFIVVLLFFQLGLALTMRLGLFPWISIAALLILVPSLFWESFSGIERKLNSIYSRLSSGIVSIFTNIGKLKYYDIRWPRAINLTVSALVFLLVIYVLIWNLSNTYKSNFHFIKKASKIGKTFQINQKWNMFAPQPYRNDGWYVIVGQLENGELVDVFRDGSEVSWDPPVNRIDEYPSYRWRKYMRNIYKKKNRRYRRYFVKYLCNNWNSAQDRPKLVDLDLYFVVERNLPDYKVKEPEIKKLYGYKCLVQNKRKYN